jgi:hypothetical protein
VVFRVMSFTRIIKAIIKAIWKKKLNKQKKLRDVIKYQSWS